MLFISYTSTEKDSLAIPLANELKKYGITTWIDKNEILNGEEILDNICNAIKLCDSGIALISPQFLAKYWTKHEIELMCDEINKGNYFKLFIILVDVTKERFRKEFSKIKYRAFDCYTNSTDIYRLSQRIASSYYKNLHQSLVKNQILDVILKIADTPLYTLLETHKNTQSLSNANYIFYAYTVVEFCRKYYENTESKANLAVYRIVIERIYYNYFYNHSQSIEDYLIVKYILELYLYQLIQVIDN